MSDANDELNPGAPGFERALAQGQFEFAKTRYARTLTGESVKNVIEVAARERARLTEEIKNLQVLSRSRYEAAAAAAQEYGMVLPHRVGKTWLQPPTALERVGEFFGSMRLYKIAAKAAKDFTEVQELLAKRHLTLVNLERQLRERLDSQEAIVLDNLATSAGLKYALRRDPLLKQAYDHLRAVANGPDGESDAFVPHAPDDLPTFVPLRPVKAPAIDASVVNAPATTRPSFVQNQFPDEPA
jgi:hypothetical protein